MATVVRVISNNNGAYTIPADFPAGGTLQVECIGGGGSENAGGGGYSKTNSITGLSAGQTVYIKVGFSIDSWFNKAANSAPASTTNGCLAKAGSPNGTNSPAGGQASAGIGDLKYSGGNGGLYLSSCPNNVMGGGGGAAGPNGNGASGGSAYGTGGGGANGGSSTITSTGGNNRLGSGGGAADTNGTNGGGGGGTNSGFAGAGSPDLVFTDTVSGVSWGPCGGGGGVKFNDGTGSVGGGACRLSDVGTTNSAYGIVVLTYSTASAASTSNFFMFF